jgi:protein arginine kinase
MPVASITPVVAIYAEQDYFSSVSETPQLDPVLDSNADDIVLSSRVRLARNIEDKPFPGWMKRNEREFMLRDIIDAVEELDEMKPPSMKHSMDDLSPLDKQILVERHLISREHAAKNAGSGLIVGPEKQISCMINEEDHLRLQAILPGFSLGEVWDLANSADSELEKSLTFAFSPNLGYLTACPTNVGTGMRASTMLHLPGLVLSDQINKVIKSVNQIGLAVRGLYGEGTEALGNLFQISNQMTLGESEQQILDRLTKVVGKIVESEINARNKLFQDKRRMVADLLGRSYGTLQNAYSISSKEALNLLSRLILGTDLGILPRELKDKIDPLFIKTQPAHLQEAAGKKLNAEARDGFRADLLRDHLKNCATPDIGKLKT